MNLLHNKFYFIFFTITTIIILSLFFSPNSVINNSLAEKTTSQQKSVYEFYEPNYGMTFKYPSNWKILQTASQVNGVYDKLVTLSPQVNPSVTITVFASNAPSLLPNVGSLEFSKQTLVQTFSRGNTILEEGMTKVGDNKAYYITMRTWDKPGNLGQTILTQINQIQYTLIYDAPRPVYQQYLTDLGTIRKSFDS